MRISKLLKLVVKQNAAKMDKEMNKELSKENVNELTKFINKVESNNNNSIFILKDHNVTFLLDYHYHLCLTTHG